MPDITVSLAADADRYVATDLIVWFLEPRQLGVAEALAGLPADGRFAAEVPGADSRTYPGIYGVRPMQLAVPGSHGSARLVPVAGLTWVGVHPDHRRQGILTAMMGDHVVRSHEAGVALSVLHASEPLIYGRHGYGLASLEHEVTLSSGTTFTAPHLNEAATKVSVVTLTASDPAVLERIRAVDLELAARHSGMVTGEVGFYAEELRDRPEDVRGSEPLRVLMARRGEQDVGYVLARRTHKWERARPEGTVAARQLHGDPVSRLVLLRRLAGLDLASTIELGGLSVQDPLLTWLPGPRGASGLETYDNLWVRLVDLPGALGLRSYAADLDLVLDVTDTAAPWNAGRWRFVVCAGAAQVTRTDSDPDLSVPVEVLGAAFLGGRNLLSMGDAGVLTEHRAGTLAQLWRAMRTDRPPVAAVGF